MKYLWVALWLVLGLLYYWIWSSNVPTCCGTGNISSTENASSIVGTEVPATDNQIDLGTDQNQTELSGAESMNETNEQGVNTEASEVATERAIAEAEEKKEVTSVKTTTETGARKLTFYFPYGSPNSTYSSVTQTDLNELVAFAKSSGKKIVVSGHTDSSSSDEFNMRLGQRRAEQVRSKIISMGLPANQVVANSYGERRPIASNETEEGKQKNRRVELIIE